MVARAFCLIFTFSNVCFTGCLTGSSDGNRISEPNGSTPKYSRSRRSLIFPSGSIMQLSLGIGVNPNIEDASVNINFGFQQNIPLPTNITQLRNLPGERLARKITPGSLYSFLETHFERYRFHGGECLQKSICEMASTSFYGDGIFESIITHLLTPTMHGVSSDVRHSERYFLAEKFGKSGGDCDAQFPLCEISPIGKFSLPNDPSINDDHK